MLHRLSGRGRLSQSGPRHASLRRAFQEVEQALAHWLPSDLCAAAALNKTTETTKCTSVTPARCILLLTRSTARVPEQKSSAMLSPDPLSLPLNIY